MNKQERDERIAKIRQDLVVIDTVAEGREIPAWRELRFLMDELAAADAKLEQICELSAQIVLRDGYELPQDVYILTRRIFMLAHSPQPKAQEGASISKRLQAHGFPELTVSELREALRRHTK